MNVSWFDGSSMYQIFPLGLCGSPHENSWDWSNTWNAASRPVRRVDRILNWVEHLKKLGIKSIFFNLALQSDTHGYNTRDFYTLDSRLGSNEDFAEVCKVLHDNGFRIVFDALFTNVGRGFWAFRDVRANLENSKYIDWFKDIDFKSNTPCNDGFYYKAWKNNWDFPELNLDNEDLVQHIFGAVRKSEDLYRFDGFRLCLQEYLPKKFVKRFRKLCLDMGAGLGGSISLVAEMFDGIEAEKYIGRYQCQSAENRELRDSICNSFNKKNVFELAYTLNRQFGKDGIFKNVPMMNFLDNHNIARFASAVNDKSLIPLGWSLLPALPGFPCIYYGSEWGVEGWDEENHWVMRPAFEKPEWNELTDLSKKALAARNNSPALMYGDYKQIFQAKEQLVFERSSCGETIVVSINISEYDYKVPVKNGHGYAAFEGLHGDFLELLGGNECHYDGEFYMPPKSVMYLKRK